MKAVFRAHRDTGGFINASVGPSNRTQTTRFGVMDVVIIVIALVLLLGTAAVMRMVLGS